MLSLAIASGRYRMTKSSILNSVLTCGLTIGFGCTAGSKVLWHTAAPPPSAAMSGVG